MIETKLQNNKNLSLHDKKIAIVYDRVNKFGGAERVLLTLHGMFPDAPLYTSVYDATSAPWGNKFPRIYTSFLQNIPFARKYHELFGWLMPLVFESFDFNEYDLVISVTSEAAKGIITGTHTKHVCYMLTPTRYLWSGYDLYFKNLILRFISYPIVLYLKWWDKVASNRPDKIVAISTVVQKRIKKYYGRDSEIIFPPVELKVPKAQGVQKISRDYYLIVSRLVKYKKVDLVVDVFSDLGLPLVIVGVGSEAYNLNRIAYSNIKFLGNISDDELTRVYSGAKAFIIPQEEDFGITSVEAQSFGVPVIAYKKGGAIDTVIDNKTGIFFDKQNKVSLRQAIVKFDTMSFNRGYLMTNAEKFSKEVFKKNFLKNI